MLDSVSLAILAATAGVFLLFVGAVVAYDLGRRSAACRPGEMLDSLNTSLQLDGAAWRLQFLDGDEQSSQQWRLQQTGSRVWGEAAAAGPRRWLVEGVAYGPRLCLMFVDFVGARRQLGALLVEREPRDDGLRGVRALWSHRDGALHVRSVRLERMTAGPALEPEQTPSADPVQNVSAG